MELWIIGGMFTLGFTLYVTDAEGDKCKWWEVIFIFFAWPFYIGAAVGEIWFTMEKRLNSTPPEEPLTETESGGEEEG